MKQNGTLAKPEANKQLKGSVQKAKAAKATPVKGAGKAKKESLVNAAIDMLSAAPSPATPAKLASKFAKATPAKGTPAKATPAKATPAKGTPGKTSKIAKATPVKATPVKAAPAKATPVKATLVKASPAKATPVTAAPAKENAAKSPEINGSTKASKKEAKKPIVAQANKKANAKKDNKLNGKTFSSKKFVKPEFSDDEDEDDDDDDDEDESMLELAYSDSEKQVDNGKDDETEDDNDEDDANDEEVDNDADNSEDENDNDANSFIENEAEEGDDSEDEIDDDNELKEDSEEEGDNAMEDDDDSDKQENNVTASDSDSDDAAPDEENIQKRKSKAESTADPFKNILKYVPQNTPKENIIQIKNLPEFDKFERKDLCEIFSQYGPIKGIAVFKGNGTCTAYVAFETAEAANAATAEHKKAIIKDHTIEVSMKGSVKIGPLTVVLCRINNLMVSERMIQKMFANCGAIETINIINHSMVSAYITFKDEDAIKKAMKLNETTLDVLDLYLKPATDHGDYKTTIVVENVSPKVDDDSIHKFFSDIGEIKEIKRHKHSAIVKFANVDAFCKSFLLDEAKLCGVPVFVKPFSFKENLYQMQKIGAVSRKAKPHLGQKRQNSNHFLGKNGAPNKRFKKIEN